MGSIPARKFPDEVFLEWLQDYRPGFKDYTEAEFVACTQAYAAKLRAEYAGDWRFDPEAIAQDFLRRVEPIRARLARGEAFLRPMPADGWLPSGAVPLERHLFSRRTGSADGGATTGAPSSPSPPPSEPRFFVVPAAPSGESVAIPAEEKGEPGRPRLEEQEILEQYAKIQSLENQGVQSVRRLAGKLGWSESTVKRRKKQGKEMLGQ